VRPSAAARHRRRPRALGMLAACALLGATSAHAGCSLGLDASRIDAGADGMPPADGPAGDTEAATPDGPSSDGGIVIPAGECQTDADCATQAKNAGACIPMGAAKCDPRSTSASSTCATPGRARPPSATRR